MLHLQMRMLNENNFHRWIRWLAYLIILNTNKSMDELFNKPKKKVGFCCGWHQRTKNTNQFEINSLELCWAEQSRVEVMNKENELSNMKLKLIILLGIIKLKRLFIRSGGEVSACEECEGLKRREKLEVRHEEWLITIKISFKLFEA